MQSFEQKLQIYADLVINIGLGVQPGQCLFIVAAPVECAPFIRLLAESGYKAGARLVDVFWGDDALTLGRFKYAPRDSFEEFPTWRSEALTEATKHGGAFLSINGRNPDLLRDQDPELVSISQRVAQQHGLPYARAVALNKVNWCVIGAAVQGWAAKIFPDDAPDEQIMKLWETIFKICRVDQADPFTAWRKHVQILTEKRNYLTAKQYRQLKYKAPGTDLTIGLPENHIWLAGDKISNTDTPYVPNMPTEEAFTMPHKDKVDGVVCSSKPLTYGGVLIEDFTLTFSEGRVVNVSAKKGEAVLKKLIDSDEGASRLGEVALVPHSSPVSQTGLLFYNTLFDENASNHLALGRAYPDSIKNGVGMPVEELATVGANTSMIHVDFMIGSDKMDVDGIREDGTIEAVIRKGEWAF